MMNIRRCLLDKNYGAMNCIMLAAFSLAFGMHCFAVYLTGHNAIPPLW